MMERKILRKTAGNGIEKRTSERKTEKSVQQRVRTRTLAMVAMMTAITCILGPLSIPIGPVPISLTNFAVFLAAYVLGWKKGVVSCLLYLLIGAVGLPVFSSFSGGVGRLLGPTGGYLVGFLFLALVTGVVNEHFNKNKPVHYMMCFFGMIIGMIGCYAFGTIWFVQLFAGSETPYSYSSALAVCVYPFILGDLIKIVVAMVVGPQLRRGLRVSLTAE